MMQLNDAYLLFSKSYVAERRSLATHSAVLQNCTPQSDGKRLRSKTFIISRPKQMQFSAKHELLFCVEFGFEDSRRVIVIWLPYEFSWCLNLAQTASLGCSLWMLYWLEVELATYSRAIDCHTHTLQTNTK